jgi:hypothetical protein
VFAEDSAYEEEGWKKRFASPTYGVALAPMTIEYGDGEEDEILLPGIELRIFNGMNVEKRGGFYTGYEVGVVFHFLEESDEFDTGTDRLTLKDINSGLIFLMSKYGYRIDLGTRTGGLSVGPVVGIGICMGGGSVDVYHESDGETYGTDTDMIFGPMLEGALEAALRLGQNFRLIGIVGVNVSPAGLSWDGDDSGSANLDGEMVPVRPDLRLGFALNY